MADDIVTRLRENCGCTDDPFYTCSRCDATDEIERLRAERDRWAVVAELLYDIMLAHESVSDDEWNQGLHECWLLMTGKTNEQTI